MELLEDDLAVEIEDEYDPMVPNNYEMILKERKEQQEKAREEQVGKSCWEWSNKIRASAKCYKIGLAQISQGLPLFYGFTYYSHYSEVCSAN